jgi:hypothetical protein
MSKLYSEKFYVRCPCCFREFDYLLATPLIEQPKTMFLESELRQKDQIAHACSGNVMSSRVISENERWPWALTCGITLKYHSGNFSAALRFGHDLPPTLYKGILEGEIATVFLPSGVLA